MSKRNIHVVPHNGQWATRRVDSDRVSSIHPTQSDAINRGREMAMNNGVELVIHRPDGRIRDKDSYGPDPCPPKDQKH